TLYDQNQISESLQHYSNFYSKFSKSKCQDAGVCDELHARSRSYVHNWIKKDKTRPSQGLLSALDIFLKYNQTDTEMVYWAGNIARTLNQFSKASDHYHLSADLSFKDLTSSELGPDRRA